MFDRCEIFNFRKPGFILVGVSHSVLPSMTQFYYPPKTARRTVDSYTFSTSSRGYKHLWYGEFQSWQQIIQKIHLTVRYTCMKLCSFCMWYQSTKQSCESKQQWTNPREIGIKNFRTKRMKDHSRPN